MKEKKKRQTDLQEQLSSPWIEYKDGTIDGFCCKISLKCLMDSNTIDICVINKPNYLIAEDLSIILR